MLNLFDTILKAQNGAATDVMAKQFNLDPNQVEDALAALMPAFSQGFKRNTADANGMASWMQALSSGQHADYFNDMTKAFQPQGVNEGNGILGHIFGNKDVSRAIAAQASAVTGISEQTIKQMLPGLASTLMGGMFNQMNGQMQQASNAGSGNVFGQIVEQMMSGAMGGATQQRQPVDRNPNPADNPLGQILEQMLGGGQVAPDDPTDNGRIPNPMNPQNNPLGKMLQDMLGGAQAQQQQRQPEPQQRQTTPFEDMFGEMFDAGRQSQEKYQDQYQRSMEQVFDQYMKGMDGLAGRR